jgi:hypothetical protein
MSFVCKQGQKIFFIIMPRLTGDHPSYSPVGTDGTFSEVKLAAHIHLGQNDHNVISTTTACLMMCCLSKEAASPLKLVRIDSHEKTE